MGDVESDPTQGMTNHDQNLEDNLNNSEIRTVENIVEGGPSLDDENAMEDNSQLGLQHKANFKANDVMQHEEDVVSPHSVHESSQDSLESRASSNNITGSTIDPQMYRATDLLMAVSVFADTNKDKIINRAAAAMKELEKMAQEGEPLWNRIGDGFYPPETLNDYEYMKGFGSIDSTLDEIVRMVEVGDINSLDPINDDHHHRLPVPGGGYSRPTMMPQELQDQHFHSEASRYTNLVNSHAVAIVELLMDLKQWLVAFSNIVSKATLIGVLSTGEEGNYDGALQVLKAEFHLPTALVPARESYFARYSKQLSPCAWGVVDFSLEDLFNQPLVDYRRRPSGCFIYGSNYSYSEVTWVEHARVKGMVHSIYRPLVASGFAFGARRWVTSLMRHYEWVATLRAKTTPTDEDVLIPQAGRESLLNLGERMRRSYWSDINTANGNMWMPLPIVGAEDIRVMAKGNIECPEGSPGTLMVFTTSFWLPVPHKTVYNLLSDDSTRLKWDIRLRGKKVQELAYILHGEAPENKLSVLQVNTIPEEIEMMYLQECYTDESGSYVIYAPIDVPTMSELLNGGNHDDVKILPCGFAILPDMPVFGGIKKVVVCGSLLTVAFNMIDKASVGGYVPLESFNTMHRIINETAALIKSAFKSYHV